MKTPITSIYKYMLNNTKFYKLETSNKTYYNVIFMNKGITGSAFIYIFNIDNIEALIIRGEEANRDIIDIKEQEEFIYLQTVILDRLFFLTKNITIVII